jgi:hypothetical protein
MILRSVWHRPAKVVSVACAVGTAYYAASVLTEAQADELSRTYHLVQTVPRTFRLLAWAANGYYRYHNLLHTHGVEGVLPVAYASQIEYQTAQELAEVRLCQ